MWAKTATATPGTLTTGAVAGRHTLRERGRPGLRRPHPHGRTGRPGGGHSGVPFLRPPGLAHLIFAGVFERFPALRFDLPHLEGTYPYSREAIRAAMSGVDPAEVSLMLGTNAALVYDFDLDALQKVADAVGPTVGEVATPLLDPPSYPDETATAPLNPAVLARTR